MSKPKRSHIFGAIFIIFGAIIIGIGLWPYIGPISFFAPDTIETTYQPYSEGSSQQIDGEIRSIFQEQLDLPVSAYAAYIAKPIDGAPANTTQARIQSFYLVELTNRYHWRMYPAGSKEDGTIWVDFYGQDNMRPTWAIITKPILQRDVLVLICRV